MSKGWMMKIITKALLQIVLSCLVAISSLAAAGSEAPGSAGVLSQLSGQSRYDFESLKVVNLMKKAKFTVVTTNGKKYKGQLEVTLDNLIVGVYDNHLARSGRLVDEIPIPFDQIAEIKYNPKRKVHLMRYFLAGLGALALWGSIASF